MGGLDTGEEAGTSADSALLGQGQIVELTARVGLAGGVLILAEHTNTPADSLSGGLERNESIALAESSRRGCSKITKFVSRLTLLSPVMTMTRMPA